MNSRIIFSTNNIIGSVLIRIGTWSRYSHCDFITEKGTVIGATAFGGVHEYDLAERIADSTHYAIYEVDAERDAVEAAIRPQLGKAYDWLGCMGIAMHRDWRSDDKWFCSELIAYAFEKAGTPLVNPELYLNRVTPEALLRSPMLKLIERKDQ